MDLTPSAPTAVAALFAQLVEVLDSLAAQWRRTQRTERVAVGIQSPTGALWWSTGGAGVTERTVGPPPPAAAYWLLHPGDAAALVAQVDNPQGGDVRVGHASLTAGRVELLQSLFLSGRGIASPLAIRCRPKEARQ